MNFNGKEITSELFVLDDSKFNPLGLMEYANNIGESLGIEYAFAEGPNGEQFDTASYDADDKLVIIPSRYVFDDLSKNEYLATKGVIDHETGHVLWPDSSYFYGNHENEEDKKVIYDIGNIIDDIRVERKVAEEFGIDRDNFKYFANSLLFNEPITDDDPKMVILTMNLAWMVNANYRGADSSLLKNQKISGKILYLEKKLISIIDEYLSSGDSTIKYVRKILELLKSENNQKVKIIKKIDKNAFQCDDEGKPLYICFSPKMECRFNEGDEITKEQIISEYEHILYFGGKHGW